MRTPIADSPERFESRWIAHCGPQPEGPFGSQRALVEAILAQECALMRFAQVRPFSVAQVAKLRLRSSPGGAEHEVFLPPFKRAVSGARVFKITKSPRWGLKTATPLEYLRRMQRLSDDAGVDVKVEGIACEDNTPKLVTSMDYVVGVHPSSGQLHDLLSAMGWDTAYDPDGLLAYKHKESGTLMRDAHPKNLILTPTGKLVPIDVIFTDL